MKLILTVVFFCLGQAVFAQTPFAFRELNPDSLELTDRGVPVFVYNHGMILKEGVPEDRHRTDYLHPVYAPNGVVLTDDFPRDHYHHRGISWMWPIVRVDDVQYDLWSLKGIRQQFVQWTERRIEAASATLGIENGWYVAERRVAKEDVQIVAHPVVGGRRDLEFTLRLEALGKPVEFSGEPEDRKGYGGFNFRFAPREQTVIRTESESDAPDSDLRPHPWAEMAGVFRGKPAGVRITIDPSNPGYPNGWCLRHYGFLGVAYPGLQTFRLVPGQPLVMKFRVSLSAAAGPAGS
jgi:hypothetical protein